MSLSLDKNDWFVNPSESTDGNLVQPLIDGEALFAEIDNQLTNLTTNDFCFYAAWEMTPTFNLCAGEPKDITDKFIEASSAGAGIRLLLFQNWREPWEAHQHLKTRLEGATHPIQLLMDRKHQRYGSHHQKFCIFGKKDPSADTYILTAFCGGIDPATDRFDNQQHRPTESIDFHLGWHDVHTKVEGPAAEQILGTFLLRWGDHAHPLAASKYNTPTTTINPLNLQLPTLQNNTHQVELLHTFSCLPTRIVDGNPESATDWGYSFAGDGIQTIKQAYLKAISLAQQYIYIENQFFSDPDIIEAIYDKLNSADVKIIVVTPYYMGMGYDNLLLDAKRLFERTFYFDNFFLCDLRHPDAGYSEINLDYPDSNYREPIYVHVKLMIVDDIYALIGSANLNLRSMETDSEMAIAVLDTAPETDHNLQTPVCKFARDLRIALFEEHLQMTWGTTPDERSIAYGINTFTSRINDPVGGIVIQPPSRVFKHNPENIYFSGANRLLISTAELHSKCQL